MVRFPPAIRVSVAFAFLALATASPAGAQPAAGSASARTPNPADVHFMSGMIPHHAQAVVMARLVPDRTSRADIRALAERIIVSQADEIAMMQEWLRVHGQPVPAADATHHVMRHDDMEHRMLMPGMLTEEELTELEAASGVAFDRLFLTFMIRHHEGALIMVDELFNSHGAAQDEIIFRFASDVFADQTTEINRMEQILAALPAP
jgi:uncharacterized protein (DUF305 family)